MLALIIFLGLSQLSMGQTSWTGAGDNKWSKNYNWTNGAPDQNKDAIIGDANFTGPHQPQLDGNAKCLSLTLGNEAIACTLSTKRNLTIYGDLLLGANGIIEADWNKSITLQGDWINNGQYLPTNINADVTFSGNAQSLIGNTTFKVLQVNSSATVTLLTDIVIDGNLTLEGILDPTLNHSVSGSGDLDVTSTGTLIVQTAYFNENYPITGIIDLDRSSFVEYASSTLTQYISSAHEYGRLRISGGSTKELIADLPDLQTGGSGGRIYIDAGTLDLKTFTADRSNNGGNFVMAEGTLLRIGGTGTFPQKSYTPSVQISVLPVLSTKILHL